MHYRVSSTSYLVLAAHLCVVTSCSLLLDVGPLPSEDAVGGEISTGGKTASSASNGGRSADGAGGSPEAGRAGSAGSGAAGAIGVAGGQPATNVEPRVAGAAGTLATLSIAGASGNEQAGAPTIEPCTIPPPPAGELVGWASVNAYNVPYTTGGGDAAPILVTNFAALAAAAVGSKPAVIHLQGTITGSLSVGSNKTIVGVCGGTLKGHVHLSASNNVIVRNLKIEGKNCTDSPTDCSNGADAVTVINNAHHIWIDHCDVSDGSDSNLDITNGSDLITVSHTRFSYSSRRVQGHQFSNLVGGADDVAADVGRLNVTFHHNWWADNVDTWMPRTRRGKVHVFNNLFTSIGNDSCTNAGFEAAVRVENNVYVGVSEPLSPDANSVGLESIGNAFIGTTGNTEGLRSSFVPPYHYTLDATDGLQAVLESEVGPR